MNVWYYMRKKNNTFMAAVTITKWMFRPDCNNIFTMINSVPAGNV